jgi:hypothetical protein
MTTAVVIENAESVPVSIDEALTWRDREYLCPECKERVRPHKEHESDGRRMAAHFEHLKRNSNCSLSDKR